MVRRAAFLAASLLATAALPAGAQVRPRLADGGPKAGTPAPDFTLPLLGGGEKTVTLSAFRGKRPVFLIFANHARLPFWNKAGSLEAIYRAYQDQAAFFVVYIRETHPVDGRRMAVNDRDGIRVKEPVTVEDREAAASACVKDLGLSIPCLLDGMDNAVGTAYAGWPNRLYVIDVDGMVAYQGPPGPKGFRPREAEEALRTLLGASAKQPYATDRDDTSGLEPFLARLSALARSSDADRSGALSCGEFVACGPRIREAWTELAPRHARPTPRDERLNNEATLLKFDTDGDRRLSPEERKAMEADEQAELEALFGKADADGDGALSEAELRAALPLLLGPGYREPTGR